jgi:hypothetical protein
LGYLLLALVVAVEVIILVYLQKLEAQAVAADGNPLITLVHQELQVKVTPVVMEKMVIPTVLVVVAAVQVL